MLLHSREFRALSRDMTQNYSRGVISWFVIAGKYVAIFTTEYDPSGEHYILHCDTQTSGVTIVHLGNITWSVASLGNMQTDHVFTFLDMELCRHVFIPG
jgi:hypothetical protein